MLSSDGQRPEPLPAHLRARFAAALSSVGARADGTMVVDDLGRRYREPHRHYHNLEHVEACLAWLDWFAGCAEHRAEVELALWFHDAVYEPVRKDNEAVSAALADQALQSLGVPRQAVRRIVDHVIATASHDAIHGDRALVVDVDLAILGSTQSAFARFEQQIRREYAHVPDDAYRRGRGAVLQGFVARDRIYQTPAVAALLESAARRNLEQALRHLGSSTTHGGKP